MTNLPVSFQAFALEGIPLIQQDDDLIAIILDALEKNNQQLQQHDVLVISSKIVSKAEGQIAALDTVVPSQAAIDLANETGKDPHIAELVLRESRAISRKAKGVLVTEHRLGFVSANAGIDQSNLEESDHRVLLLPLDPDNTARQMRQKFQKTTGSDVGIIISDTHGRPFRLGNVGVAIGVAGIPALLDLRGNQDLYGRTLEITQQGYADMIASAAHLLCGEGNEGRPVIVIRGLPNLQQDGKASDLYRPPERDLYR